MTIGIQDKIKDWQVWLRNGDQYFSAAVPKGKKSRFDTSLRYNLLSMSFEGYTMAISDFYGVLPENHTYTDLVETLEKLVPLSPSLKNGILKHESIQNICSLEDYHRSHPDEKGLEELTSLIAQIALKAHRICKTPSD